MCQTLDNNCQCLDHCCSSCCCECGYNFWQWLNDHVFKPTVEKMDIGYFGARVNALIAIPILMFLFCMFFGVPIADIAVGSIYLDSNELCNSKMNFASWMIVKGCLIITQLILYLVFCKFPKMLLSRLYDIVLYAVIVWQIFGWAMFFADCQHITPKVFNDYIWFSLIFSIGNLIFVLFKN